MFAYLLNQINNDLKIKLVAVYFEVLRQLLGNYGFKEGCIALGVKSRGVKHIIGREFPADVILINTS